MTGPLLAPDGEPLVEVGEVVGTHGVRGELRIRPFNPTSEALDGVERLYLVRDGAVSEHAVLACRPHGAVRLVRFDGVTSIEQAGPLLRRRVAVPRSALPELAEGEFYHYELIGLAVVDETGEALGEVSEVLSAGGNDVLSLRSPAGERLVPMDAETVRKVDLEARRIVIRPLPGLFG